MNMNGIRSVVAEPVRITAPEYSPAAGSGPEKVTVRVAVPPAASVELDKLGMILVEPRFTPVVTVPSPESTEQQLTLAASVTEPEPIFVRVISIGAGAELTMPKEAEEGTAVTFAVMAAPASSRPAPIHSASTGAP